MNMYADNILDHYKHPRNYGEMKNADAKYHDINPTCGDNIEIFLRIDKNKVSDVKFSGHGCAISQAGISMLTEHIIGKSLADVKRMEKEDIFRMLGIEISHARIKCALLGLKVLKLAAYSYMNEQMSEEEKEEL